MSLKKFLNKPKIKCAFGKYVFQHWLRRENLDRWTKSNSLRRTQADSRINRDEEDVVSEDSGCPFGGLVWAFSGPPMGKLPFWWPLPFEPLPLGSGRWVRTATAAAAAGVVGWRLIFLGGRTVLGGGNSSASFLHLVTAAAGRKYFGSEAIFRARAPGWELTQVDS